MVRKYMFLREFWTNIRSSNNELNLFGNLLAGDKNIYLQNEQEIHINASIANAIFSHAKL
jgi:hypothetical protein